MWGLTPSLPKPVKFRGSIAHTYTPPKSIFDGPVTNLLSILLCALLKKSFQVLMRKERKSPNNFKFGIFIVHLLNGGMASIAVKGA